MFHPRSKSTKFLSPKSQFLSFFIGARCRKYSTPLFYLCQNSNITTTTPLLTTSRLECQIIKIH
eukprot:08845.XXX_280668_280859_1 [CDS] Oithona nana genome sequencing.